MDKKSEQSKDHKECGDTDVGIHNYNSVDNAGKRQQLDGLWSYASKEVVGLPPSRIATNCYKKGDDEKVDLLDEIIEHGPPLLNRSRLPRVF